MGLPLIVLAWPPLIIGLLPIILIEALILRRYVPITKARSIKAMGLANLASTILGVPVTWFIVLLLQEAVPSLYSAAARNASRRTPVIPDALLALSSPGWLPNLDAAHMWMLPVAMLVLLVVLFGSSWLLENEIAWRYLAPASSQLRMASEDGPPEFDYRHLRKGTFYANLASYGVLEGIVFIWLVWLLVV